MCMDELNNFIDSQTILSFLFIPVRAREAIFFMNPLYCDATFPGETKTRTIRDRANLFFGRGFDLKVFYFTFELY